jgi:prepilin-type N-terminal cleavage/methylation domain-containing protein
MNIQKFGHKLRHARLRHLAATGRKPSGRNALQRGFTLVEIMVVIGIMAILSAVVMMTASTDSSKATALFASMTTTSDSLERMKMDVGCYPTDMSALWVRANASAANMWCGQDGTSAWDGAYLKTAPFDTTNQAIEVSNIAPNAEIAFSREAGGSNGFYYFLHGTALPNAIVLDALLKCNGSNSTAATFSTGKCRGTLGGGGAAATGTFDLMVEDAAS